MPVVARLLTVSTRRRTESLLAVGGRAENAEVDLGRYTLGSTVDGNTGTTKAWPWPPPLPTVTMPRMKAVLNDATASIVSNIVYSVRFELRVDLAIYGRV